MSVVIADDGKTFVIEHHSWAGPVFVNRGQNGLEWSRFPATGQPSPGAHSEAPFEPVQGAGLKRI